MGVCNSREERPQNVGQPDVEKPSDALQKKSQQSHLKANSPRKNRKNILHPKLHIEGVPDITEASSSDSLSATAPALGKSGSHYRAADLISPRTVQTVASETPESLYSSSNTPKGLLPLTTVLHRNFQNHRCDNSPTSADQPQAVNPCFRTDHNFTEPDDGTNYDSVQDAGTETYEQLMRLQSLIQTANGKLTIKPSTPPRKSPKKQKQKSSSSRGDVKRENLSPPRGVSALTGNKSSPKRGKALSTRLVPLHEEQESCCSEGTDGISIIPEEVDPDAPSDEEDYRDNLIRNTPPDEPGRLVPVKWRTAYAKMPKPTSIQMRPLQPLHRPPEADNHGNNVDNDSCVNDNYPAMAGLTPAQRELRRELAKRNAEHEYLKKAREKWKAKQKQAQQAVDQYAVSQFQKLQLQVQLADRQARQSAKVNKLEDRFKDVQEYKKLWKQYETLQSEISTRNSVTTSEQCDENDTKSLPSSGVAGTRPRRRANSFDLKDSKNWFFDFQKVDLKPSSPDGAKVRKRPGESLSLLSAKSMEVQRRLFAEKRRERKRKEKERKRSGVRGSTSVPIAPRDEFDCNDTYKASGAASGADNGAVTRTYSYESGSQSNFRNPPRDYGPTDRGGIPTLAPQILSRSNSASSFTAVNIEVSFSPTENGGQLLQEQPWKPENVDTVLDDASMVSDLADDNSTLASGSHFNNDYRVPRRHRARPSVADDVLSMASGSAYSYSKRSRATRHSKNSSSNRQQWTGTNAYDKSAIQARIQSLESAVASLVAKNTSENKIPETEQKEGPGERSVDANTSQHDAATAELLKVFEALSAPVKGSKDKTPFEVRKALLDSLAGQLHTAELLADESRVAGDDVVNGSPPKVFLEQAAAGVSIVHKANHAMLHKEQPSSYVVAQVRALATPSVLSTSTSSVCSLGSSTSLRNRFGGKEKQPLSSKSSRRSHKKTSAATVTKTSLRDPPSLRRLKMHDNEELSPRHLSVPCPPDSLEKCSNDGEKVQPANNDYALQKNSTVVEEHMDGTCFQKRARQNPTPSPAVTENPVASGENGRQETPLASGSQIEKGAVDADDQSSSCTSNRSRSNGRRSRSSSQQRGQLPTAEEQNPARHSTPFHSEIFRPASSSSSSSKSPYDPIIYSLSTEQFLCLAERPKFDHVDLVPSDEEGEEMTVHLEQMEVVEKDKTRDRAIVTSGQQEQSECDSRNHGNDDTRSADDANDSENRGEKKCDDDSVCVKSEHDALDISFLAEFRERGNGADAAYQNLLLAEKVEEQVKSVLSKYREVDDVASRTSPSSSRSSSGSDGTEVNH